MDQGEDPASKVQQKMGHKEKRKVLNLETMTLMCTKLHLPAIVKKF